MALRLAATPPLAWPSAAGADAAVWPGAGAAAFVGMRCRGFPAWRRPSARLANSTGATPTAIHCIGQYKASILAIAKKNTLFVRHRGMSGSSGTITFQYRRGKGWKTEKMATRVLDHLLSFGPSRFRSGLIGPLPAVLRPEADFSLRPGRRPLASPLLRRASMRRDLPR